MTPHPAPRPQESLDGSSSAEVPILSISKRSLHRAAVIAGTALLSVGIGAGAYFVGRDSSTAVPAAVKNHGGAIHGTTKSNRSSSRFTPKLLPPTTSTNPPVTTTTTTTTTAPPTSTPTSQPIGTLGSFGAPPPALDQALVAYLSNPSLSAVPVSDLTITADIDPSNVMWAEWGINSYAGVAVGFAEYTNGEWQILWGPGTSNLCSAPVPTSVFSDFGISCPGS